MAALPNDRLRKARERTASVRYPGLKMTRQEAANSVNAWLAKTFKREFPFTAKYLGRLENGEVRWPGEHYRAALQHVYGVSTEDDLGFLPPAAARAARVECDSLGGGGEADAVLDVLAPSSRSSTPDLRAVANLLGPVQTLNALDRHVESVIARYELEGPHRLVTEVVALRGLTQHLREQVSGESERIQLARTGMRLAALLSYMAVNLSKFDAVERYLLEGSLLATAIDDTQMLAWFKGTQSFSAYYQGQYQDAFNLAQAGLRIAGEGPQRIRLLSNGLARAAGKLGDRHTTDQAIDEALTLLDAADVPAGMTPCIDFAAYGWARTAANAATAYLAVGDYAKVLNLTGTLSAVVAESDSDWSRSLVSLDEATALALGKQADLEHAASVGLTALAASATKPIASVGNRARELAASLSGRGTSQAGKEFEDALAEWYKGSMGTLR